MSIQVSAQGASAASARRRTTSGSGVGTFDVGNTLTYSATGLSPSTPYVITVQAYDSGGVRGANSTPLSVTTTA